MQSFKDYCILKESPVMVKLNDSALEYMDIVSIKQHFVLLNKISIFNKNIETYTLKIQNITYYRYLDNNIVIVAIDIRHGNNVNMVTTLWQDKKYIGFAKVILLNNILPIYKKIYVDIATTHLAKNSIIKWYKELNNTIEFGVKDLNINKEYKINNINELYAAWQGEHSENKCIYLKQT